MLTRTVEVLTAAAAAKAVDGAEAAAAAKGVRVSTAVVDAAGMLLAFRRMDGALPVSIAAAQHKARTAAWLGGPTKAFQDMLHGGATMLLALEGVTPVQGGVPIVVGGVVVGAIGCSGGSGEDDEAAALAGAAALQAGGS